MYLSIQRAPFNQAFQLTERIAECLSLNASFCLETRLGACWHDAIRTLSGIMMKVNIANGATARAHMVETQLVKRGISDPNVIRAMRSVPRESFVRPEDVKFAYDDGPLSIGSNQTISQPFIVALMIEALRLSDGDAVLEIGVGSGYAAAILSEITQNVFAIERIKSLADFARSNLMTAGYCNVQLRHGDGTEGWSEAGPFDAILVSAGAPSIPKTLERQLKIGGRMVVPVGHDQHNQELLRVTRLDEENYTVEDLGDVRFVPLIGEEGWHRNSLGFLQNGLAHV